MTLIYNDPLNSNYYLPHKPRVYDFIGYWDTSVKHTPEEHLNAIFRLVVMLGAASLVLVFPDVIKSILVVTIAYAVITYAHFGYIAPYVEDVKDFHKQATNRVRQEIYEDFADDRATHRGLTAFYESLGRESRNSCVPTDVPTDVPMDFHNTMAEIQENAIETNPMAFNVFMEDNIKYEKSYILQVSEQLELNRESYHVDVM